MGRTQVQLVAVASLSAHNSDQDREDQRRWDEFVAEVKKLADRPEYADIDIFIAREN